jgi:hypothetical protein
MCDEVAETHKKSKASRNHDLSRVTAPNPVTKLPMMCTTHKKLFTIYDRTCQRLLCGDVCQFMDNHISCEMVSLTREKEERVDQDPQLRTLCEQLDVDATLEQLATHLVTRNRLLKEVEQDKTFVLEQIEANYKMVSPFLTSWSSCLCFEFLVIMTTSLLCVQARELLDAAYAEGKREAELLYARKLEHLHNQLADLNDLSENLAAGRQWLSDYMQHPHQQAGGQAAAGQTLSVSAKLEAATRAVYYRDTMRRSHEQVDPADKVQPRLNLQDMDEEALNKSLKDLFRVTDPEVPRRRCFLSFSFVFSFH